VAFTRRQLLHAGFAGLASLSLPDILRLQAAAKTGRHTSVIFLFQEGGATQFETYDPKPDMPAEMRGEFKPIATSVPGVHFSELMTQQAKLMHKLTLLRGIHHPSTQHSSSVHLAKTGYYCRAESNVNEMPSVGSHVSRLRGPVTPGLPPHVVVHAGLRYDSGHFIGSGYDPLLVQTPDGETRFRTPDLNLMEGVTLQRLSDRRSLLAGLDQAQREWDRRPATGGVDQFRQRAFDMVAGPAARRAFDLEAEPLAVRERYGLNPIGQRMLMARRLVEHGVTFVTVGTFGWDHHDALWRNMRRDGPPFDRGVAALVEDLHLRSLERKVLVVIMGEFGRTAQISSVNNLPPGRDHWGEAMSVILFGGGLPGGQVIGATDGRGTYPTRGAYRAECILAHMYRHLGIDPATTVNDQAGRPHALLPIHDPIRELV
jgi:hypothetical protein